MPQMKVPRPPLQAEPIRKLVRKSPHPEVPRRVNSAGGSASVGRTSLSLVCLMFSLERKETLPFPSPSAQLT